MYDEFRQILDAMRAYGYAPHDDYTEASDNCYRRLVDDSGFSFPEHIGYMVCALLSIERHDDVVRARRKDIDKVFHGYDPNYIKTTDCMTFVSKLEELGVAGRQTKRHMSVLAKNVETLEALAAQYGSLDNFYDCTDEFEIMMTLARGKYKLECMGISLVCKYLQNAGVDVPRPDKYLKRITQRLGYAPSGRATNKDVFYFCNAIATEYKITNIEADAVLRQFCSPHDFGMCAEAPYCVGCPVACCIYRSATLDPIYDKGKPE